MSVPHRPTGGRRDGTKAVVLPGPGSGHLPGWALPEAGRMIKGPGRRMLEGGTYDTPALLFVNRSSWAYCVAEVARLLSVAREAFLSQAELEALDGKIRPHGVIIPQPPHDRERP